MLNNLEVEMLEQLLENDRLQKQLLQELFGQLLNDEYGISTPAYQTLCELGEVVGIEFEGIERSEIDDEGRVCLTSPEEIPKELDKIEHGQFYIHVGNAVGNAVGDDELWDWAEAQTICTIEHLFYDPEEDYIVILPMLEECLTKEILDQLKRDILLKLL
ncbi:MAG: hypothetical protein CTY12_00625 [Methylotenera sp.]|nr:MAG: hypothetical protein CTY12_00625 [Methylotenera sp.]